MNTRMVWMLALAAAASLLVEGSAAADESTTKTADGDTVSVSFEYRPGRREKQTLKEVNLAGEFNGWDAFKTPMKRDDDGVFRVSLDLPPGTYQWKLLLNGSWVQDMTAYEEKVEPKPDAYVSDPYGGKNAQTTVRKP